MTNEVTHKNGLKTSLNIDEIINGVGSRSQKVESKKGRDVVDQHHSRLMSYEDNGVKFLAEASTLRNLQGSNLVTNNTLENDFGKFTSSNKCYQHRLNFNLGIITSSQL